MSGDDPDLAWGPYPYKATATVGGSYTLNGYIPDVTKKERKATPPLFRDWLIWMARSVYWTP